MLCFHLDKFPIGSYLKVKGVVGADIDDIYRDILLAHNIDVLRHIVVLLLCIVEES